MHVSAEIFFASAPVASSLWERATNAWTGPTCGNQLFVTQMSQLLMQRAAREPRGAVRMEGSRSVNRWGKNVMKGCNWNRAPLFLDSDPAPSRRRCWHRHRARRGHIVKPGGRGGPSASTDAAMAESGDGSLGLSCDVCAQPKVGKKSTRARPSPNNSVEEK